MGYSLRAHIESTLPYWLADIDLLPLPGTSMDIATCPLAAERAGWSPLQQQCGQPNFVRWLTPSDLWHAHSQGVGVAFRPADLRELFFW